MKEKSTGWYQNTSTFSMQALATSAHIIIPLDSHVLHFSTQAPVDVMGIIVGLGAPGSIKRKSDNSDVQRRDVTLVV